MSDGNTNEAENSGTDDQPGGTPAADTDAGETAVVSGDEDPTDGGDEDGDGGTILDDGGIDTDARAGRSQGIDPHSEPDEDTQQEIEEEREKRLDPENRPDGAEIDNTQRDFDVERGQFTDSEDYDPDGPAPFATEESDDSSDDEKGDDSSDSEEKDSSDA